jgi:ATP-binding cassette subfamily C protein
VSDGRVSDALANRAAAPGRPEASPAAAAGFRFVAAEVFRRRGALAALLAWSLLESAPALVSGRFVAAALDQGFLRGHAGTGLAWLLALGCVTALGALGTRGMYPRLGDVVEPLRDALVTALIHGTLARACDGDADRGPLGAAPVARLTRQVETVRDTIAGQLLVVRQFAVTAVAVSLGLASLALPLAGLVLGPLLLALLGFALLLRPMVRRQRAAFLAEERVTTLAGVAVEGLRDITAAGAQSRIAASIGTAIDTQYRLSRALAGFSALRRAIVVLGGNLPLLLILLAAGPLLRHGLTTGALVGALTYVTVNLEPALRTLVQGVGASALRLSVAIRRLAEGGLAVSPRAAAESGSRAQVTSAPPHAAAADGEAVLTATGLCFRYGPHADPVVAGLDLKITAGELLVIVGPSGAGKSTLVNLLSGLLRPDRGEVSLLGEPLAALSARRLPTLRALIPQEAYVFAGTLRENLVYLRPDATDAQIVRAAAQVGAQRLLAELGGLDARLVPALLSPGRRQLLALVRGRLSRAPLLLLDEATCHLDQRAERRAEAALRERPGALVLVAHRIGSARRADRVLLLDGERTDLGTHEELMARSAQYADIVGHWYHAPGPAQTGTRAAAAAVRG